MAPGGGARSSGEHPFRLPAIRRGSFTCCRSIVTPRRRVNASAVAKGERFRIPPLRIGAVGARRCQPSSRRLRVLRARTGVASSSSVRMAARTSSFASSLMRRLMRPASALVRMLMHPQFSATWSSTGRRARNSQLVFWEADVVGVRLGDLAAKSSVEVEADYQLTGRLHGPPEPVSAGRGLQDAPGPAGQFRVEAENDERVLPDRGGGSRHVQRDPVS